MLIAHRIELDPTVKVRRYFVQACGCDRFAYNWALAQWQRQAAMGIKPRAMDLKKQFNAIKYQAFPWLKDMHRDAHAQPFANLAKAWTKFFDALKDGARPAPEDRHERRRLSKQGIRLAYPPRFKKKGKSADSFYVANDKLHVVENRIKLPKVGVVRMKEALRFGGRIMGAVVSREAERWFVSLQVEVDVSWRAPKDRRAAIGVDVNTRTMNLSGQPPLPTPRPLAMLGKRLAGLQRKAARKIEQAKVAAGMTKGAPLAKGQHLPQSSNLVKLHQRIARLHARIARIRLDFLHQLTTKLCRENQAITIEDLSVSGMTASARGDSGGPGRRVRQKAGLNRALLDGAPGEFKRQMRYKVVWYGNDLTLADRFYPSSQICSTPGCDYRNRDLALSQRTWTCPQCRVVHDRDDNAANNLEVYVPGAIPGIKPVSAPADMQVASQDLQGRN